MPYALFSGSAKVSRAFAQKSDVWRHAADSGLVVEIGLGEEDPPRRILDMGYGIHECTPDAPSAGALTGLSESDIANIIAVARVNPPSAAAAS